MFPTSPKVYSTIGLLDNPYHVYAMRAGIEISVTTSAARALFRTCLCLTFDLDFDLALDLRNNYSATKSRFVNKPFS
jgi:hypothetical protein